MIPIALGLMEKVLIPVDPSVDDTQGTYLRMTGAGEEYCPIVEGVTPCADA